MKKTEQSIIRSILKNLPRNRRLFRINAGMGWAGKFVALIKEKNRLLLDNPYPLHAAPQGWPDLCGWEEIEITPDMVGKKIACFLAVEVKASGEMSYEQKKLMKLIEKMGGKYEIITEEEKPCRNQCRNQCRDLFSQ